jgi:C1A family cysteine protease
LVESEKKMRLGLVITDEALKANKAAMEKEKAEAMKAIPERAYPPAWDWRFVSYRNRTSRIKDQGSCGSCVAFAVVAGMESNFSTHRNSPYRALELDVSEADLFFCGCGECCGKGWYFDPALDFAKQKGVRSEWCYPYWPHNQYCRKGCLAGEKPVRLKIKEWKKLCNSRAAKKWISSKGPVITGMQVFSDFFDYKFGIYQNATGGLMGYHAVLVVGYDDLGRYWICQNSWGDNWGEGGWFKIGYGDSGIGEVACFYGIDGIELVGK